MLLPTQPSKKNITLNNVSVLIYGEAKIGKSTFCSRIKNALTLDTENGLNSLEVFKVRIDSWEAFLDACKEIKAGKHNFETIVIDTIDKLYDYCVDYICQQGGKKHIDDFGYGKGQNMVVQEIKRALTKFVNLPYGIFLVSHSKVEKAKEIERIVPTIHKDISKAVIGMVDQILLCEQQRLPNSEGKLVYQRIISTEPSIYHIAGDRTNLLPKEFQLNYHIYNNHMWPKEKTKTKVKSIELKKAIKPKQAKPITKTPATNIKG